VVFQKTLYTRERPTISRSVAIMNQEVNVKIKYIRSINLCNQLRSKNNVFQWRNILLNVAKLCHQKVFHAVVRILRIERWRPGIYRGHSAMWWLDILFYKFAKIINRWIDKVTFSREASVNNDIRATEGMTLSNVVVHNGRAWRSVPCVLGCMNEVTVRRARLVGYLDGWPSGGVIKVYFWKYPNFLLTQCRIGGWKLPRQTPARFFLSFR